jgi:hypothetical protein
MPHEWVNDHTAGYFRDDLSDRIIVLDVSMLCGEPLSWPHERQTLHISANALLSYVLSHPSELPIPWEAWGPGIARLVSPHSIEYNTLTGKHTVCGTRALSTHVVRNRFSRPVICLYDFHPQRVNYARTTLRHTNPNDVPRVPERGTTVHHPSSSEPPLKVANPEEWSYLLGETGLPCLVKEIPIPPELLVGNPMLILCEDAIVLVRVSGQFFF